MTAAFAVLGFVIAVVGALAIARQRFQARIRAEEAALFAGPSQPIGPRADPLPRPVRRHLENCLPDPAVPVTHARMEHGGTFRASPTGPWKPIRGREVFAVGRPEFVWSAAMAMGPGIWAEVRDCLIAARGNMQVRIDGAIPIVDARGTEIDQGAAMRWLAETPWFPQALASAAIRWEEVDDRTARAHLAWPGPAVAVTFALGDDGRFVSVRGERYLGSDRKLHPWKGAYRAYRRFGDVFAPSAVEVTWELAGGDYSYARFEVSRLAYECATPSGSPSPRTPPGPA